MDLDKWRPDLLLCWYMLTPFSSECFVTPWFPLFTEELAHGCSVFSLLSADAWVVMTVWETTGQSWSLALIWSQLHCVFAYWYVSDLGSVSCPWIACLRITIYPECLLLQYLYSSVVWCCSPSKQQRASVSSEETESGRSSPDPQPHSPKHQHNRRSEYNVVKNCDDEKTLQLWKVMSLLQVGLEPINQEETVRVWRSGLEVQMFLTLLTQMMAFYWQWWDWKIDDLKCWRLLYLFLLFHSLSSLDQG